MGLEYPAIPLTTPFAIHFDLLFLISPKRKGSAHAITLAPMHATSRTIPPTPVAAPSYGTICEG